MCPGFIKGGRRSRTQNQTVLNRMVKYQFMLRSFAFPGNYPMTPLEGLREKPSRPRP